LHPHTRISAAGVAPLAIVATVLTTGARAASITLEIAPEGKVQGIDSIRATVPNPWKCAATMQNGCLGRTPYPQSRPEVFF